MKIKNIFGIDEYLMIVEELVDGYFNDYGEYTPHVGRICALETFFNHCVIDYDGEIPAPSEENPYPIEKVFADEEFQIAYDNTVCDICSETTLTFGNAYTDAAKIVEDKRNGLGNLVNLIGKTFSVDNLLDLFKDSDRYKEIMNNPEVKKLFEGAGH